MQPSVFSRRDFIKLTGLTAAGMALGCAVNPVTGQSQLMLVSEGDEVQLDHQSSPFQLSADYAEEVGSNLYLDKWLFQQPRNVKIKI
jgi:hypothetical protein